MVQTTQFCGEQMADVEVCSLLRALQMSPRLDIQRLMWPPGLLRHGVGSPKLTSRGKNTIFVQAIVRFGRSRATALFGKSPTD